MSRLIPGPVLLIVLDGWGIGEAHENNGITSANTPNYDRLSSQYPFTTLHTSGIHVGLPDGQMGNSEVGHTTIGAGTVIFQDLVRISRDVASGALASNSAISEAINHTKYYDSQLHLIGLVSPGGVHSHEDHFFELARAAKAAGVGKILLHIILDGRDTSPTTGRETLKKLKTLCLETGAEIATMMGRYFAMDRDNNWDRTDKAFQALWHGQASGSQHNESAEGVLEQFYNKGLFDEHIEPVIVKESKVSLNDSIIFTNFRTDRTRQLSQKISEKVTEYNLCYVTMTNYGPDSVGLVAYEPQTIENTIASCVSQAHLKQAHVAETEKFPHATYFLNGGKQDPHENEEHVLIPSRKDIKTHDQAPEMMAQHITDAAIERLNQNDFIFINYANADMVGHTAKREAILTAVETVDAELGRICEATLKQDGALLVIADHGNAEQMIDPLTGEPHTAHTTNIVPCILVSHELTTASLRHEGGLKDIAPTILALLGIEPPDSMTGKSLLTSS